METSIAQRIKNLRTHYHLGIKEFADLSGLSHVAIFHLENGKTLKPHRSSIQRIASVFGSTAEWIMFGKNEMLPNGSVDISAAPSHDLYWKETAITELKNKNVMLEREVDRLWEIIRHFTGGKQNFHRMMEAG